MISDLGKALDPVADKLTQVSVVLCLAFRYKLMWILLGLCVFRETCMFILGLITVHKTDSVYSARWYGKVSTFTLYATALALLVFRKYMEAHPWLPTMLIILCMFLVVMALVLYTRFFTSLWKEADAKKAAETEASDETSEAEPLR